MPTWTLAMVVTSLSHSTSYSTHSPRAIADKESEGISGKSTLRQLFKRIIDAHNGDAAKSDGYASPEHHVLKHDDFTLRGARPNVPKMRKSRKLHLRQDKFAMVKTRDSTGNGDRDDDDVRWPFYFFADTSVMRRVANPLYPPLRYRRTYRLQEVTLMSPAGTHERGHFRIDTLLVRGGRGNEEK
ncbi:hypothetical protein BHE74_00028646 [Ensete ventricosum]|nr:hypothetical protein BHE74_00028646 [Ensete ventricosum]